eukprot:scaffold58074_cov52-Phaeocystis_antarctica.AAC.2
MAPTVATGVATGMATGISSIGTSSIGGVAWRERVRDWCRQQPMMLEMSKPMSKPVHAEKTLNVTP